jgi:hypothetical protein
VLGALPLLIAIGVYNTVVSGAPWVLPFSLLEPDDAVGYGVRRLLPEDTGTSFYPPQGVQALLVHFGLGSLSWYALGALLLPAAVVAWLRPATPVGTRVLLAGVLVLLLAYTAFWGPYNYTFLWKQGAKIMGPVYGVALLVPVVIAALPVLQGWLAARRWVRGLAVVAVLVAAGQLVGRAVRRQRRPPHRPAARPDDRLPRHRLAGRQRRPALPRPPRDRPGRRDLAGRVHPGARPR